MANPEFHYQPMFDLGPDKTEYYLLTKDYVSVSEFEGKPILKIEKEGLTAMANAAFRDVSFLLRRAHNEQVAKILRESKISYIKWDMNRSMSEVYSTALPAGKQGEVMHRYILGVYDLYSRLTTKYPHILFESCSSGGARFDPAMLYFAPQAWSSDNSDAVSRLKIQYGTSMVYPISSIGAHISAVPNHQVDRITSLKMRGDVAYFGTFGYELDLTKLTEEERTQLTELCEKLQEKLTTRNVEEIKTAKDDLEKVFQPIVTKMYEEVAKEQQAQNGGTGTGFEDMFSHATNNPFAGSSPFNGQQ